MPKVILSIAIMIALCLILICLVICLVQDDEIDEDDYVNNTHPSSPQNVFFPKILGIIDDQSLSV